MHCFQTSKTVSTFLPDAYNQQLPKQKDNCKKVWCKIEWIIQYYFFIFQNVVYNGLMSAQSVFSVYSLMCFVLEYFLLDSLELAWFENGTGASFINLSCLPALINSSCLHKLFKLSDISNQTSYAQVRIMFLYNLNMYLTILICFNYYYVAYLKKYLWIKILIYYSRLIS